jgi:hypothetical protein
MTTLTTAWMLGCVCGSGFLLSPLKTEILI